MITRTGEAFNKRGQLEVAASQSEGRVMAAVTGNSSSGELGISDLNKPFNRQQEFLTGFRGADALNPAAIGNRLRSTQTQITQTKTARDNATGENQGQLSEQLAILQGNAQRLGQALENLADSSNRNAIIQEKINKLEEDRQGRLSFTEKLLTASPRERLDMQRNANLSDIAASQGNFAGFNPREITRVLDHLASVGNTRLPGYGNATGADVRERLLTNSGVAVGTIDPRRERMRIGLLGQQAANDRTAVSAQDQIANNQASQQQAFFGELKQIQQTFFDKLRISLAEAAKRDVDTQQGVVAGKQKDLNNAAQSLDRLNKGGFSLDESRMLNSNANIGQLSSLLERKKGLSGGISDLKGDLANNSIGAVRGGLLNVNQENDITSRAGKFLNLPPEKAAQDITVPLKEKIKSLGAGASNPKAVNQTINSFLGEYQKTSGASLDSAITSTSSKISKDVYGDAFPANRAKVSQFAAGQKDYGKMLTSLEPFTDEKALRMQQQTVAGQAEALQAKAGTTNAEVASAQQQAIARANSPVLAPTVVSTPDPTVAGQPQAANVLPTIPNSPVARTAAIAAGPVTAAKRKKRATYKPTGQVYSRMQLDSKTSDMIYRQEALENDRKKAGSRDIARAVAAVDADAATRQAGNADKIAAQTDKDAKRRAKFAMDFKRATGKDLPSGPPTAKIAKGETPREIRERRRRDQSNTGNFIPPQLQQQQISAPTAEKGADPQAAFGQNVQGLSGVVDGLNKALVQMGSSIGQFGKLLEGFKFPDKLVLERSGRIEVVLNGTEVMNAIKGDLAESVTKEVMTAMQEKLPKMVANLPA
jgi:hypothetical protein